MTSEAQKLLQDALRLPEEERADLAGRLIESLDRDVDGDWQSTWSAEVLRRVVELDSGSAKAIRWAEARRRILEGRDEFRAQ